MLALGVTGRVGDGIELLSATIERIAPVDREVALSLESALAAMSKLVTGGESLAGRWRRYGPIAGTTPAERMLLSELAWERAMSGARAEETADLAERSIADGADRILLAQGTLPQFFQAVHLLAIADRFDRAQAALAEALVLGHRSGSMWLIATAEYWLADTALRRGHVRAAESHAEASAAVCANLGWQEALAAGSGLQAESLVERGQLDAADRVLAFATPASETPPSVILTCALESRAALRIAQRRGEAALEDLFAIRDREARPGGRANNPASCPWRSRAALALRLLGADGEAKMLAREELALARRFGAGRAIGIALHVDALFKTGLRAEAGFAAAAKTLERAGAPLDRARALADLGAHQRRDGHRIDARGPLRQSLELAHACGADSLVARALEDLRASGARPRRMSSSGVDALTASERRVADLARSGLDNPSIAQALFVSRKTVETHLGTAYRKLGISSRTNWNGCSAHPDARTLAERSETKSKDLELMVEEIAAKATAPTLQYPQRPQPALWRT